MPRRALWEMSSAHPAHLAQSPEGLEAHLANWIEADPSMLRGLP